MTQLDLSLVKLDHDRKFSACAWTKLGERIAQTLDTAELNVVEVEVRESGKGFHVLLQLAQPLASGVELVAVQAMLGSDSVREALNLTRARSGRQDDWNVLFQMKADRTTRLRLDYAGMLVQQLRRVGMKPRLREPRGVDWQPVEAKTDRVVPGVDTP